VEINECIEKIVYYGTLAPSADNCQPWQFNWDGNTLYLLKVPERSNFFYDIKQESILITFGAVIENIKIAASYFGLIPKITILPKGLSSNIVATINFYKDDICVDPLFSGLAERHTNRNPFYSKEIQDKLLKDILNEVNTYLNTYYGVEIHILKKEKEKQIFKDIIYKSDIVLFEEYRLYDCLFKWIRFEKSVIEPSEGMSLNVLGLNSIQKILFPLLAHWPVVSFLNRFGLSKLIARNSLNLLSNTPAYILLTTKNNRSIDYLFGGMAMERFWIAANNVGLSIQPMFGFIFLINHYLYDNGQKFHKRHQKLIQRIYAYFLETKIKGLPIAFFRLGYASRPKVRTKRRSLEEVLKIKNPQLEFNSY